MRRKGNVIARVIDSVRSSTLQAIVNEAASERVSLLCIDQWVGYNGLDSSYSHATVDHGSHPYGVGAAHTQTIEGFWSIFKRCVIGIFPQSQRQTYADITIAPMLIFSVRPSVDAK